MEQIKLYDLLDYVHSEVGVISIGARTSYPFLAYPHQLICSADRTIFATNTGRNSIEKIRQDDFSRISYRYTDVMWDVLDRGQKPGAHYNSLFERNGKLYVLAHNHGKNTYVLVLNRETLELIEIVKSQHYSGMHNIWVPIPTKPPL